MIPLEIFGDFIKSINESTRHESMLLDGRFTLIIHSFTVREYVVAIFDCNVFWWHPKQWRRAVEEKVRRELVLACEKVQ